jgi:hypothetical protein
VPGFVSKSIKLLLACLVVGLLLALFDVDPIRLMQNFPLAVQSIFEVVATWVRWAVPYIMLGAVVVVPIWLIFWVLRVARNKRPARPE